MGFSLVTVTGSGVHHRTTAILFVCYANLLGDAVFEYVQ